MLILEIYYIILATTERRPLLKAKAEAKVMAIHE